MRVGRLLGPVLGPLLLALVAMVQSGACGAATGPDGPHAPRLRPPGPGDLPDEDVFLRELDRSRGHRDVFPVIREPEFVPVARAPRMRPDELVVGLDLGTVQFAYAVNLLNHHEIVEHTAEGIDLLVCW